MEELLNQLRRLHCQWGQLETTGQRLEMQILRNVTAGKSFIKLILDEL